MSPFLSRSGRSGKGCFCMLRTTTTTENIRLTKANNINTYVANNDGLTTISESSHAITPTKAKSRTRANKGPRTSVQRAKDRNRWLDSLYNNYADHGTESLKCSFFTGHFDSETKSVQVAQNRVKRFIESLNFGVECYTSIIEYDQFGLCHVHLLIRASSSVLNYGVNYLHDTLIKSWPYGKAHAGRIYNLENLGFYMMMSDTSKAKTVKQAVKDEQDAKETYNTVKGLNVPASLKNKAKKEWRQSHMAKKKAVAKAYEKHSDKIMKKSYGQKHGVKVRACRADVWAFIVEHGQYLGSTTTRISSDSHLINVVKRDVYRLNDSDTRELQHMLSAIQAYQNANDKAVA